MRFQYRTHLLATAICLSLGGPVIALAQSPAPASSQVSPAEARAATLPVREFYDALLYTMKHAKQLGIRGRFAHLEPAVSNVFDFEVMTQFTVGQNWGKMTPHERVALMDAFRKLTTADYARSFNDYGGESFVVRPKVEKRDGDDIVSTQMNVPDKAPIPFVYRMHKTPRGWRIVDIYLNGYISEVATRRADFASTLQSGGVTALTRKLDAMADQTLKN